MLVERLEKRSANVLAALAVNNGNWEEIFYQFLAANFGFKTNALPFEMLAKSAAAKLFLLNTKTIRCK